MSGNQAFFANKPNINIGRTRWPMRHDHPTSFQHGKCVPIDCIPILPGDSFKLKLSSLIRMSQPIVPLMDNIRANVYVFFVPMRLVWNHTKEYFGENSETAGPQLTPYKIPTMKYGDRTGVNPSYLYKSARPGSISHYLHKPICNKDNFITDGAEVSVLKERAYYLIWNTYFRAQQFTDPVSINFGDFSGRSTEEGICNYVIGQSYTQTFFGSYVGQWESPCLPCGKQFDYFTSATLLPQYGATIEIPLGDYAPLGVLADENESYFPEAYDPDTNTWLDDDGGAVYFGAKTMDQGVGYDIGNSDNAALGFGDNTFSVSDDFTPINQGKVNGSFETNLIVNLSRATAASVNNLRASFAAQRFLERCNFGTRYNEYLQVHYQVTPPMGLLQYPELLGEHHWRINIQQVLSTAGAADDTSTKLGQPGANSVTADSATIFKKAFVEHGFLMTILTTTHDRHYTQGFLREDLKRDMLEIYHPEFATLGDQALMAREIFASANVDDVFGYQEHWAEYRYRPSRASGLLDPVAANGLAMWTLTDTYASKPTLSNSFIYEDRSALASSLVTGNDGPDYIADFYFDYDVIRAMPLYSNPGRIDHIGGW